MREYRDQFVQQLRAELFGPAGGSEEIVTGKPVWRYLCGMLFPSDYDFENLDEVDEQDPEILGGADAEEDPAVSMAYDTLPSSMGISFFISDTTEFECEVEGAVYQAGAEKKETRKKNSAESQDTRDQTDATMPRSSWQRVELGSTPSPSRVLVSCPGSGNEGSKDHSVLDGKACINVLFRPRSQGYLVTVSLINVQKAKNNSSAAQIEAMLFQCRFRVRLKDGEINAYPQLARYSKHPEDEELALVYRNRRPYGIGHGCTAEWDKEGISKGLTEIVAEPLPVYEVHGLTNDIDIPDAASRALSLRWLIDPDTSGERLESALEEFVKAYEEWIEKQHATLSGFEESFQEVGKRLIKRQEKAVLRMRSGIKCLVSDQAVLKAFRVAQEAMLRQFLWSDRWETPLPLGEGKVDEVDPWSVEVEAKPHWRPFQLAYQLLVLESIARPDSKDRDTLDLLWFPTGGGKTEAYLAVAAFEIAYRRMQYGESGAGTAVIMRYTLRLLTAQQFERAAVLISVLETMRKKNEGPDLGETPISLGLWVGEASTPNLLESDRDNSPGAVQLYERMLEDEEPKNPFQLLACPFCGTEIVPESKSADERHYGIEVDASAFRIYCPDDRCLLHDRIPVSVVDEDLYGAPPTFLVGTIDKFARMPWEPRSRVFLGRGRRNVRPTLPPQLIIQDELHLITGPLGTIVGTYEAALDTVLRENGVTPKYLAATATIQRSAEQCRSLYARDAFVFPPTGLDVEDSFFSREDVKSEGRTFVGAMGNGMYSSLTQLVQGSTAAAHAAGTISESEPLARDSYWTQVIYHNSKQELGKTTTMLRDDVDLRLEILEPDDTKRREFERVEELSANISGKLITEALIRLKTEWPSPEVIDALACTNMISVGVDISRLGLMIVKGQPKSTAEYIQATSRIGRDRNRPSGVVLVLYAANRPRDRSVYESFQSYHHALYREVEPVSVTPFSPPARDRSLHASLVAVMRHSMSWERPQDAKRFDRKDGDQRRVLTEFKNRLDEACREDESSEVRLHLDQLVDRWQQEVGVSGNPLSFGGGRQFRELIVHFTPERRAGEFPWPTLNSMRHVDGAVRFHVRGEREN